MPVIARYTTEEILDEIMEKYSLEESFNPVGTRDNLRKKITSICKQIDVGKGKGMTNLWEKAAYIGEGNIKAEHRFTENEKQRIYNSLEFRAYLSKICMNDTQRGKLKEEVENERQAELANQKEREYWENFDPKEANNDCTHYGVTQEQVKQKKLEIMIEAVFLKFFEPIDEALLESDMNAHYMTEYTAETMASFERLKKHTSYYAERKPTENTSKE